MNRAILFTILLLFTACTAINPPLPDSLPAAVEQEWPTKDWPASTLEAQGIDPQAVAAMAERAKDLNLHSLLILRNGFLVYEAYYAGYDQDATHEMYSVTKSFTGTLVGIAVDQGLIPSVQTPVKDILPELTPDSLSGLTVEHLLTMTTGLDWQECDPVYREMYRSANWVQYVLDIPVRQPPGDEFNYCSGCSHVLTALVQQVAGQNLEKLAKANLFKPLGIQNYTWETGSQNVPIGGWGLQLTPRDMAKLGYLYLNNGQWDGKQIVSEEWIAASTRVQVVTDGDWEYGYQWWVDPRYNAYAARGRYGQLVYVSPDYDLIVVSTAAEDSDEPMIALIEELLLPAIQP